MSLLGHILDVRSAESTVTWTCKKGEIEGRRKEGAKMETSICIEQMPREWEEDKDPTREKEGISERHKVLGSPGSQKPRRKESYRRWRDLPSAAIKIAA